ncbi:MAG: hypothetical protein RJB66_1808 [Pseudomonadota bacterium]
MSEFRAFAVGVKAIAGINVVFEILELPEARTNWVGFYVKVNTHFVVRILNEWCFGASLGDFTTPTVRTIVPDPKQGVLLPHQQ